MNWGKIIRRTLMTLLIVTCLLTAAIVGAAVQIFDGVGEWHTSDAETVQIAMDRAKQRAENDAKKKAGIAIKAVSRSINSELADDAVSAVTNNIIELVGDVHYDKKIIQLSEIQTTILYTAKLKAKIDTDGIYDWIKRDDKEKVTIIQQNDNLQEAIQKNDELAESLTEQYLRAKTQAEKDRIRKQMKDADRDFLANQKLEEGNKLYYAKDYNGAIKLYDEVIKFGEYAEAYNNRGNAYSDLGQKERAIQDFNKAIQLNPNYAKAYNNRGNAYDDLGQKERAIQDYTRSIELNNPELYLPYYNRGIAYMDGLKQYERAIQDFNKAIQLNPNDAKTYNNRGIAYKNLGQYERAIQDYNKAIELNPNLHQAYNNRGVAYALLGNFKQAIADVSKAIELEPNDPMRYRLRGLCYQELGKTSQAQADFAKAKELGYNG